MYLRHGSDSPNRQLVILSTESILEVVLEDAPETPNNAVLVCQRLGRALGLPAGELQVPSGQGSSGKIK